MRRLEHIAGLSDLFNGHNFYRMLELFKRVTGAYDLLNIALLYFKHLIYYREHQKQTFFYSI